MTVQTKIFNNLNRGYLLSTFVKSSLTNLFSLLFFAFILLSLINSAFAQISFGRSQANSSIGQPLNAYVEVFANPNDASTIRGRAYRPLPGGGIDNSITTSIRQSQNGVTVQLGSLVPINDPYLDVVVELINANRISVSQRISLLINPSANNAYSIPPEAFSARAPRKTTRSTTKKAAAVPTVESLDKQISAARKELKRLEDKVNEIVAKAPTAPTAPNASTNPPGEEALPPPIDEVLKDFLPEVTPPAAPTPPVVVPPPQAPSRPVAPVAQPTPTTPKPAPTAQATRPAEPKPTRAAPPPPPRQPVQSAQPEGLFGISWLPNPLTLLDGFDINKFLSPEILYGILGLVAIIIAIIVFSIVRKRKSKKATPVFDEGGDDTDPWANMAANANEQMDSETDNLKGIFSADEDSVAQEEVKQPKKKKSFLDKLKKFAKKPAKKVDDEDDEASDFAAIVAKAEAEKSEKSENKVGKSETKIQRFDEEDIKPSVQPDIGSEDDFLKDLENLTSTGKPQAIEPTVMVNSPSQTRKVNTETVMTPASAGITEESSSMPFSDEITRVSPLQNDDVVASALMDSDDDIPSARKDHKLEKTDKSPDLIDDDTDISFDDLDFSSEKTMIMPQLKEMVKEAQGEGGNNNSSQSHSLDLDMTPSFAAPAKANTASPITPTQVAVNKEIEETDNSFDMNMMPDFSKSANSDTIALPEIEEKSSTPIDDNFEFSAKTDLTDISSSKSQAAAKTQLTPTQIQATQDESSYDNFDLPNISIDLPDISNLDTTTKPQADEVNKNQEKEDKNKNNQAMIDLAALDLSSIKLD